MLQIVQNMHRGAIRLMDIPDASVKAGNLLVRNAFSVVSIGTEMMKVRSGKKSLAGKAMERPDQVAQVVENIRKRGVADTYKRVMNRIDSLTPLGYSSAGTVVAVGEGVKGFKVGDRVACGGSGHAEMAIVPKHLCALVPDDVPMEYAAFTTLGAIAMHGVRQSGASLGENIVVVGLGLVGQILVKILMAAGCNVVGVDLDEEKLSVTEKSGIDMAIARHDPALVERILGMTDGRGADAVILAAGTSSNDPIMLAPKITRDRGKLVVLGISKMDIPWRSYYEKEIDVRLSRSYGPGRYDSSYEEDGIDYPIGYVRWTEQRNMSAFLRLVSGKRIVLNDIITRRFHFSEAENAYEQLNRGDIPCPLGVLFEYAGEPVEAPREIPRTTKRKNREKINLGMVGAGNYARNTIMPILKTNKALNLVSIVSESGLSATDVSGKFGFQSAGTDASELFRDGDVDTVIIATKHDTHAKFVVGALEKDKNVFVEKPLALTVEELEEIETSYAGTNAVLMVGFNRRFSSHVREIKTFFKGRISPLALTYRVNSGAIPPEHWYQHPQKGGGRIIGECCHFVDVLQYISGEAPRRIYAESLSSRDMLVNNDDTVNIVIKFSGGSIATINYFSCGDPSYPKERLEVLGENAMAVLEDYNRLELIRGGKKKVYKNSRQDKGHDDEFRAFFDSVAGKTPPPISFQDMKNATLATIGAVKSFKTGAAVVI
jgi:polar amino acid transport system substrate-binding protein